MTESISLVTTLVMSFGFAFLLGIAATQLRLPALLGYLAAGIILSPHVPGILVDTSVASQFADIGIMLLMFGVGLHFSIEDLLSLKTTILPGAIIQMLITASLGTLCGLWFDFSIGSAVIFGLSLSVASTVVLLKALESQDAIDTFNGKIAVGWLIVEDLVMILVLVLLPAITESSTVEAGANATLLWQNIGITLINAVAFIALMLVIGQRLFPWILWQVASMGSHELFVLCVISVAVGIAYAATAIFGVSFALGAFFAGMVLRNSEFSRQAAEETLPLREAFSVLFFVSIGMFFNPDILVQAPYAVLSALLIIFFCKSLIGFLMVILFRYPLNTALMIAVGLTQIGEFSFILTSLGLKLNVLTVETQQIILSAALFSISFNPILFKLIAPLQRWIQKNPTLTRYFDRHQDPLSELPYSTDPKYLTQQVVLVGYGKVGQYVAHALQKHRIPFVVAEKNRERVEELRSKKFPAVYGDASEPGVLIQAHVSKAKLLIITTSDTVDFRQMIQIAQTLNPTIDIAIRTHSEEEMLLLHEENIGHVFYEKHELAENISQHAISLYQTQRSTSPKAKQKKILPATKTG